MKKLTGPNWPEWPQAWIDERRKKVRVTGKSPTWRSHLKAKRDTTLATLAALGFGGYAFLGVLKEDAKHPDGKSVLIMGGVLLVGWIVFAWRVLHPYLLNTHHARSVHLELTPEHIRVDGRRFKRRQKHGQLLADFRIIEDDEAAQHLSTKGIPDAKIRHLATTSLKVQLILRGECDHGVVSVDLLGPGQTFTLATVLGKEKAEQCSVVCQAAEQLVQRLAELD